MFYVPSTARSFRGGTIYCPLRRTWSSVNTPFPLEIEPWAVAWQSITLPLRHASSNMSYMWSSFKTICENLNSIYVPPIKYTCVVELKSVWYLCRFLTWEDKWSFPLPVYVSTVEIWQSVGRVWIARVLISVKWHDHLSNPIWCITGQKLCSVRSVLEVLSSSGQTKDINVGSEVLHIDG